MMLRLKKHTSSVLLLGIMALAGCHKQPKPSPIVPPPVIPDSAMMPLPEVLPPPDVEPAPTQPAEPVANATKPRPRPRNGRKITDLKPTPAQPPATSTTAPQTPVNSAETSAPPPKITASPHDVPTTTAISEGLPHSDEMHRRETAAQLNQSTEDNLRSITRALTAAEKGIVEQIRNFMAQSQEAISENDLVRAHNLALKAHLLSDELTNH